MRVFAWCLVVAGLVIGMIRDIDEEVRPAGGHREPWPGVIAGAGVSAFGVLILAIRRPERSERIE